MPSPPFSPQPFREDSSYLVVGGFGGIGREICRWLAKNKAKNIIAISRSGLTNPRSVEFAAELSAMPGVHFRGYACNVANESELQEVLRICNSDKIRGVIHGAMELKVRESSQEFFAVLISLGYHAREHELSGLQSCH